MSKNFKMMISTSLLLLTAIFFVNFALTDNRSDCPCPNKYDQCVDGMPIVKAPLPPIYKTALPNAKVDSRYVYYLQCSVQITYQINNMASIGSGTICHYDYETNEMYIVSCGHIFEDYSKVKNKPEINVITFYKNNIKLETPESFSAELLCYDKYEDISFLKIKSDWEPSHWFPIGPANYGLKEGDILESTGCDGGDPPAAYTVEIAKDIESGNNIVTKNNSPRPGRSGGGLFSKEGYLIGIVWGTTVEDGSGYGFYVPINRIHEYMKKNQKVSWLINATHQWQVMYKIPIVFQDGSTKYAPEKYFPL